MSSAVARRLILAGAAAVSAMLAVAILIAPALGFRWDPFDRADRRIADLEARLARAEAAADASARLALAQADLSGRLESHHRTTSAATQVVADVAVTSLESPDADIPLPLDRAARLRDADRRLCGLAPELCASAPAQPPGRGDHAVPTADPSRGADPVGS